MAQYIDKSALVAEIERQIGILERNSGMTGIFGVSQLAVYEKLLNFINALEVKDCLGLTVEDIKMLDALLIKMWNDKSDNKYEEVLKQFKAQKGEQQ